MASDCSVILGLILTGHNSEQLAIDQTMVNVTCDDHEGLHPLNGPFSRSNPLQKIYMHHGMSC